jgi:hypothetical protein
MVTLGSLALKKTKTKKTTSEKVAKIYSKAESCETREKALKQIRKYDKIQIRLGREGS